MNKSIMDQLQAQEMASTPKSRLPRKLQERDRRQDSKNRDIEAFIGGKSPGQKKHQAITKQAGGSSSEKHDAVKRDEAY